MAQRFCEGDEVFFAHVSPSVVLGFENVAEFRFDAPRVFSAPGLSVCQKVGHNADARIEAVWLRHLVEMSEREDVGDCSEIGRAHV